MKIKNKNQLNNFLKGWAMSYRELCTINEVEYIVYYDDNFNIVFENNVGCEFFVFKSKRQAINYFF